MVPLNDKPSPSPSPYRRLLWTVAAFAVVAGILTVLGSRRFTHVQLPENDSLQSPSPDDAPAIAALLTRLDDELRLPTTTAHPPRELLKQHDAEFARRRMKEVLALKAKVQAVRLPKHAPIDLKQAVRQELAAINGEQRALNRLTRYDDELGRKAAHDNYRKRRVEVFLAERKRRRLQAEQQPPEDHAATSRQRARRLRKLKELDRRYVALAARALDEQIALLQEDHAHVDYHDPLYLLYNDEIRALRREKIFLGRSTLYHGLDDRTPAREKLMMARRESSRCELTTLLECQRRLAASSPVYWDIDRLIALLRQAVDAPGVVLAHKSPTAALVALATTMHRERPLVDAWYRYCFAMGRATIGNTATHFQRCATALQRQLNTMDQIAREAERSSQTP